MSAPTSAPPRSALSKREFVCNPLPAIAPSPSLTRTIRRVHVAAEILKAAKVCAGDVIILRRWEAEGGEGGLEEAMEGVSLEERRKKVSRLVGAGGGQGIGFQS